MVLKQRYLKTAKEFVEEFMVPKLDRQMKQKVLVVLSGSAVTEFADRFSSVDLVVVCPREGVAGVTEALGIDAGRERDDFYEVRWEESLFKYQVYEMERCRDWLKDYDDFAMGILAQAEPVYDPGDLFDSLVIPYQAYPADVLADKIEASFEEFRRRQASLVWTLRRGQPFTFLDNLLRLFREAFRICFYLEGDPPPGRKWLFQGAMKTGLGRKIRPIVLELFGELEQVAMLGGQMRVRETPVYGKVKDVHEILVSEIERWNRELDVR